jgi:hypothetical protein
MICHAAPRHAAGGADLRPQLERVVARQGGGRRAPRHHRGAGHGRRHRVPGVRCARPRGVGGVPAWHNPWHAALLRQHLRAGEVVAQAPACFGAGVPPGGLGGMLDTVCMHAAAPLTMYRYSLPAKLWLPLKGRKVVILAL